jgi:NTE family protein
MTERNSASVGAEHVSPAPRHRAGATGSHRRRTAFVLSGGASLAAAQVGMLQALYEHRIAPDFLVGTSAGALNAAFVASRPQTPATAKRLGRIWCDLCREDVFPVSLTALVGGVSGRRDHLVPDRGLRALVRRHLEFDDLAHAPIPLHVVAFDLIGGREVLLSDGSAVDAIAASSSIPGIYPPVAMGEQQLVDGGVVNNTPISHAVALGAEKIYVLPAQHPCRPLEGRPKTALDAAVYGVGLLIGSRLESDIARYSRDVELVVMPAPNAAGVQPTSFEHSSVLISEARTAARSLLNPRAANRHLRVVSDVNDDRRPALAHRARLSGWSTVGASAVQVERS